MKKAIQYLFLIPFFIFYSYSSFAITFQGEVVSIQDGDTITAVVEGKKFRIRLYGIDAPEKNQPGGLEAKEEMKSLCENEIAEIEIEDVGMYGRLVGKVYCKNYYVNKEMVKRGYAWVYENIEDKELKREEEQARIARRGIWALNKENIIPPWEWRRRER